MASEWVRTTLGKVVDFLSGGTPSKGNPSYWNGSIPWVSAKDMKGFRLDDTEDHITELGLERGSRLIPAGTVLLLARGMTLLNDVPISVANRPMAFNQDVKALRPKGGVHEEYLPYLLLGDKHRLLRMVDLAGHGTGRLNTDELKSLEVSLPPLPEQRAIAHILGTLDDKLELNRRMNETLEAIAATIFRAWFVDFDPVHATKYGLRPYGMDGDTTALFPDRFEESSYGTAPCGWRHGTVRDLVSVSRESIDPTQLHNEVFDLYSIPAFDRDRAPEVATGSSIGSSKFVVSPKSILISRLNPHQPRVWMPFLSNERRAICSTEFFVAVPKPRIPREFVYGLFTSALFSDTFASLATGTTGSRQRVRREDFLNLRTVIPDRRTLDLFAQVVRPLHQRIAANHRESSILRALRDTLLPKLVSGEIRVAADATILESAP